jgi:hypothetical protein
MLISGHPCRRRGHAPVLDADPPSTGRVTTPDLEPHTAYHCLAAGLPGAAANRHPTLITVVPKTRRGR